MKIEEIVSDYYRTKTISEVTLVEIQQNEILRKSILPYFKENKNRDFALELLERFVTMRKKGEKIAGEDIMLAGYILGLHGQIADSLIIWDSKNTDFDTFPMIDIQLVVFGGINETIEFLKNHGSDAANDARNYILKCAEAGDFDELADYFSDEIPWFA